MSERKAYVVIALQSAVIGILLVMLVFSQSRAWRVAGLEEQLDASRLLVEKSINRNDSISLLLQECRVTGATPPFIDGRQIEDLQKMGLSDPLRELREDLAAGQEIIGSASVLGGTMGFYFMDGIHILNKRWVFAYFEDGHLAGAMLLRYDIDNEGNISWKVLDEMIY
ncbi:MAG: hypothetical protein EA408_03215 [Marinilabiliales bacterium]|nr:MAG: hypothetical protein EA408_03215 [Marinilabiliales bacterium]